MFEIIVDVILYIIFAYPGAAVRWLISRLWKSNKTFKEILDEGFERNGLVGITTLALVLVIVALVNPQ